MFLIFKNIFSLKTYLLLVGFTFGLNFSYTQVVADFSANVTEGCGSLAGVQFTDLSTGNITSWNWSFGNNNSSTLASPSASYPLIGSYTVSLTVSDGITSDTKTKTAYINVYPLPSPNFTFSPLGGCTPLKVDLISTSTSASQITGYLWDFGDGSQSTQGASVSHTYQSPGKVSISLEVTDQFGCKATIQQNDTLSIAPSPIVNFASINSPIDCNAPYQVNFQSNVLNKIPQTTVYKWDFGDGTSSSQENPSHTYSAFGRYDVTLIAINPNCSDTLTKFEYVRLEPTSADFTLLKKEYCLGDTLRLTNQSTGSSNFLWQFSKGSNTSAFEPNRLLNDSGKIIIELTAATSGNCIATKKDSFYVQHLIAEFTTDSVSSCTFDKVTLTANASHRSNYEWRLGLNLGSDTLFGNPMEYIQPESGLFNDSLLVTSLLGCKDTIIKNNNRYTEEIIPRIANKGKIVLQDTIKGCLPLTFNFEDSSISNHPITSHQWDFDFGRNSSSPNPTNVSYTSKGLYKAFLTVQDAKGCRATIERWVSGGFQHNPDYTIFPDTLCSHDSITILDNSFPQSEIDSFSYTFKGFFRGENYVTGFKGTNPDTTTRFDNSHGHFEFIYTVSDNGCDSTLQRRDSIFVKGPVADPVASSDCIDRMTIMFNAFASGYTDFYWDFGDGSPYETNDINPTHTYSQPNTYNAKLYVYNDTNGCDTMVYKVVAPAINLPPLQFHPKTMEYCLGEQMTFRNVDSTSYVKTEWYLDGKKVSPKNLVRLNFEDRGKFEFEIRATDVLNCIHSLKDTLYISRPISKIGSKFLDACAPVNVDFIDSSLTDTTITNWEWRFGNGETSNQARDSIFFPLNSNSDVFLKVTNIFGCADSITVQDYLSSQLLNVHFTQSTTALCEGDSVLFRNATNGLQPSFNWDFGDGGNYTKNDEYIYYTYKKAGEYTVSLTALDENGCEKTLSKTLLIDVDSIPTVDFTSDIQTSTCPPLNVQFSDLSSSDVNQWRWNLDSSQLFQPTVKNPKRNYTKPGTYDIILWASTPNGCADSLVKQNYISVGGPEGSVKISPDFACINDTLEFNAIGSANLKTAYWDFGDGNIDSGLTAYHAYDSIGTITISAILKDTNDCVIEPILTDFFVYEVKADFSFESDSFCAPIKLNPSNQSIGASSYSWNFGNGTQSSAKSPSIEFQNSGLYEVSLAVNSTIGCKDTAYQSIYIKPTVSLSEISDTTICAKDTIILTAQGADSYLWRLANASDTLSTKSFVQLYPMQTDSLFVRGNNAFNCPDSTMIKLNVFQEPIVPTLNDTSIIIGEEVQLNGSSGLGFSYLWTPKEGVSCNHCPMPVFKPEESTEYTLSVSDPFNCFPFETKVFIEVLEQYSLDVPQAFSPNGDGINDVVFVKGWGLKELISFKIYNRFGEVVFESKDFDKGWDGIYKGKPQNIETYVYTVEALTYGEQIIRKKGNLNLIR